MKKHAKFKQVTRQASWWIKLSLFSLRYWPVIVLLFLAILVSGAYVYSQLIAKDGFPDVNDPIITVSAHYLSDDLKSNDLGIAQPLNAILAEVEGVISVNTLTTSHNVSSLVLFEGDTKALEAQKRIANALELGGELLPADLELRIDNLKAAKYLGEYDMLITVFDRSQTSSLLRTQAVAEAVAEVLARVPNLNDARVIPLLINDAQNGPQRQVSFNQIGLNDFAGRMDFYQAVHIGIVADTDALDSLQLQKLMEDSLANLDFNQLDGAFETFIIEDRAQSVERNLNSLENNLLTGLIVISLISLLLISWRAAVVIALFIMSVLATAILLLYGLGYSLNLVTLFALILALGLLVDDAVIMVESLDNTKSLWLSPFQITRRALNKVLLASLAGTLTTALVFVPLAFIEGILGEFILFLPITMILTLLVSFVFSITLIPVLAKFSILKEKPDNAWRRYNPLLKIENWLANKLADIPLLLQTRPRAGRWLMTLILGVGLSLIFYSFNLFNQVDVNIFPPLDDSNNILYAIDFPNDYDLAQAEASIESINTIVVETLGLHMERVNYLSRFIASESHLEASIVLKDLPERKIHSPILVDQLQQAFDHRLPDGIQAFVRQIDVTPPAQQYPLIIPIVAENLNQAQSLAQEISLYLTSPQAPRIQLANGESVSFKQTRIKADDNQSLRFNNHRIINLQVQYDQLNVNTRTLDESDALIRQHFNTDYLTLHGYDSNLLSIATPTTSFEKSFDSLFYIFPLAILLIYLLLCWQFRSWFQPLIILVALPFAVVGVVNWLYFAQNPFSFNVTVGLIALLGIAINNTILLTAYANVAMSQGLTAIEAISQALRTRFRPLIMTTLTTIFALLPLALNDFFWRQLAWTIIFGLAGSTILVIFLFPYCYLGATNLATKLGREKRR